MSRPTMHPNSDSATTATGGLFIRLFWMAGGNVLMVAFTLAIVNSEGFSWRDAALWASAGLALGARYIDIARGTGETTEGQPATMRHWRRHAVFLIVVAACLTALAHVAQAFV